LGVHDDAKKDADDEWRRTNDRDHPSEMPLVATISRRASISIDWFVMFFSLLEGPVPPAVVVSLTDAL